MPNEYHTTVEFDLRISARKDRSQKSRRDLRNPARENLGIQPGLVGT